MGSHTEPAGRHTAMADAPLPPDPHGSAPLGDGLRRPPGRGGPRAECFPGTKQLDEGAKPRVLIAADEARRFGAESGLRSSPAKKAAPGARRSGVHREAGPPKPQAPPGFECLILDKQGFDSPDSRVEAFMLDLPRLSMDRGQRGWCRRRRVDGRIRRASGERQAASFFRTWRAGRCDGPGRGGRCAP